jgi:glucose/arabinose dehydrogenase
VHLVESPEVVQYFRKFLNVKRQMMAGKMKSVMTRWMMALGFLLCLPGIAQATPDPSRMKLQPGHSFHIFAADVPDARLMQLTPKGDILVSTYAQGGILLLQADRDGDGLSDGRITLVSGLNLPHGLWLEGNKLYVAEETEVSVYDFDGTALTNRRLVLSGMPDDGGHVSRTIKRGPDGLLYVSIGSSCNVCIEAHPWRAAMLRLKEGGEPEIFAHGLRNTVGFDWQPGTGALYGVDNGRDMLGDDIPDDELNLIVEGRHYGWPYTFGKNELDPEFGGKLPKGLELTPLAHGFGAHVAPLSIRFLKDGRALVAQRGSWNRSTKVGYRVVALTWEKDGSIREEVFMEGCLDGQEVLCRPVDVIEAADGTVYVSDDTANAIYAISKK